MSGCRCYNEERLTRILSQWCSRCTNASFTGNSLMASDDIVYLGRGSFDVITQFNGLLNSFEFIKGRNLYSANFTTNLPYI